MPAITVPAGAPMASARRLRSFIEHYLADHIIWPTVPLEAHPDPDEENMFFFRQEFMLGTPGYSSGYGRLVIEAHRDQSPEGQIRIRAWHVYRGKSVEITFNVAAWMNRELFKGILKLEAEITTWIARGAFDRRS